MIRRKQLFKNLWSGSRAAVDVAKLKGDMESLINISASSYRYCVELRQLDSADAVWCVGFAVHVSISCHTRTSWTRKTPELFNDVVLGGCSLLLCMWKLWASILQWNFSVINTVALSLLLPVRQVYCWAVTASFPWWHHSSQRTEVRCVVRKSLQFRDWFDVQGVIYLQSRVWFTHLILQNIVTHRLNLPNKYVAWKTTPLKIHALKITAF